MNSSTPKPCGSKAPALEARPKGIASVELAVSLLRVVEASAGPIALKDIAQALGFSPSKAHHYLVSLVRSGLLEREPGGTRYALGSLSLQLGLTALSRSGTANVVGDSVRALRDETGQACAFSVWSPRGPVVRHLEESREPVSVSMRLGSVLPLLNSPTASIFLAWLPEKDLQFALQALPPGALPLKKLVEIRQETRRLGGAHACGVRTPSIAGAAAPVFAGGGRLAGALSMVGLIGQFDDRPTSKASRALRQQARELSEALAQRGRRGPAVARRAATPETGSVF